MDEDIFANDDIDEKPHCACGHPAEEVFPGDDEPDYLYEILAEEMEIRR